MASVGVELLLRDGAVGVDAVDDLGGEEAELLRRERRRELGEELVARRRGRRGRSRGGRPSRARAGRGRPVRVRRGPRAAPRPAPAVAAPAVSPVIVTLLAEGLRGADPSGGFGGGQAQGPGEDGLEVRLADRLGQPRTTPRRGGRGGRPGPSGCGPARSAAGTRPAPAVVARRARRRRRRSIRWSRAEAKPSRAASTRRRPTAPDLHGLNLRKTSDSFRTPVRRAVPALRCRQTTDLQRGRVRGDPSRRARAQRVVVGRDRGRHGGDLRPRRGARAAGGGVHRARRPHALAGLRGRPGRPGARRAWPGHIHARCAGRRRLPRRPGTVPGPLPRPAPDQRGRARRAALARRRRRARARRRRLRAGAGLAALAAGGVRRRRTARALPTPGRGRGRTQLPRRARRHGRADVDVRGPGPHRLPAPPLAERGRPVRGGRVRGGAAPRPLDPRRRAAGCSRSTPRGRCCPRSCGGGARRAAGS